MIEQATAVQQDAPEQTESFLTFVLDGQEYGVEVLKVREIIGMMPITQVPRMPAHVKGVINLRGKVVPVIDLRVKFGLDPAEPTRETCVVVANVDRLEVGLIVDRVCEVTDIPAEAIAEPPQLGADVDTHFIMGMGKTDESVKILLDVERILASREIAGLGALSDDDETEQPE